MEFESEAQKKCYERVLPWFKELFGELAVAHDALPLIGVSMGSAFIQTAVFPWGDDDATITTRSYVVTDVQVTADLMRYLLMENARLRFGAFGLDEDGDIVFEHSIVGSTCDKEEVKASVLAVGMVADKYDDEIRARWGGQRALERRGEMAGYL
jgi:hypothetical protein